MHNFEYASPRSLDEAMSILKRDGADARLLAGGTDLIVMMRTGRRQPKTVVNAKDIPELNEVSLGADGLTLGAAVSCKRVYDDPELRKAYPGLIDSASLIGGTQIQGRAAVGGNLCNAAPSADCIPTLIAHGVSCRVIGPDGERTIAVEDFCVAPGQTSLKPGELVLSMHFPRPPALASGRYLRFIPRNEMDIAVAGSGVYVELDNGGDTFKRVRIGLASVGPTPIFAREAGDGLAGKPVSEESMAAAGEAAAAAAKPISDMRGTVEQRKHLVKVLTTRALRGAVERAKGNNA